MKKLEPRWEHEGQNVGCGLTCHLEVQTGERSFSHVCWYLEVGGVHPASFLRTRGA